ncbi:thiamine pyrophosphate-binding protein [Actinoplanes sp. NPDC048796]|uniref:thiamine pyrophosphate-binding protein n=1 Tax=unclassified Actinoplanes TaxID=2626549 RepID=UPI0033F59318
MAGSTHAQAFAEAILSSGRTHVFALLGEDNAALLFALRERGVEVVPAHHESAAVAMAEGYAWATGRPGICSVPHGLGLSEVVSSLRLASRNRSAVVLIAAAVEHEVSAYRRMWPGEDPAAVLADALSLAADRLRPVVVGVGPDLLAAPVRVGAVKLPAPRPRIGLPVGDDAAVARRLTAVLARAKRPVLLAGRGLQATDSAYLVRVLAERTGAALATTLGAKGLFDGHAQDLGLAGDLAHPAAERVLRAADLVLAFGTARSATGDGDAAEILALLGDAATRRPPWFTPVGSAAECWREDLRDHAPPIPAGTVDPRRALATIDELIPADAVVVVGGGRCEAFACALIARPREGRFIAAESRALPLAIGAALASPGRKVVVFDGDLTPAGELTGLDLTLFLLNPGGAGVGSADDVAGVARAALRTGPAIVEIRTAPEVVPRHRRGPAAREDR